MTKHTKGPWEAVHRADIDGFPYWVIQTVSERGGWDLADVRMDVPDAEGNARVMAAAGELLEALAEIVSAADGSGWEQLDPFFEKARAAITRARGEA